MSEDSIVAYRKSVIDNAAHTLKHAFKGASAEEIKQALEQELLPSLLGAKPQGYTINEPGVHTSRAVRKGEPVRGFRD